MAKHKDLLKIVITHNLDYEPWGKVKQEDGDLLYSDCSSGCKFYHKLDGSAGYDWGVCTNPNSHRAGLLTFEHQGCTSFKQNNKND